MASLAELLDVFDVSVAAAAGPAGAASFVGGSDPGERDVIDGSQALAQALVAAAKTVPGKWLRSAHATFSRPLRASESIELAVEVEHEGRSFTDATVSVSQGPRRCATVRVLMDVPQEDLVRHPPRPLDALGATGPEAAIPCHMPLPGRELRLTGCADPNDPGEVGPPVLDAWVRYDQVPERDDLAKALLAHFTGHLSISTTLRAHPGLGTAQAHHTLSTAVMTIQVVFHEPVRWDGWLLYRHESTFVGAGMSFVRGEILTVTGALLGSFTQEGMIRPLAAGDAAASIPAAQRL